MKLFPSHITLNGDSTKVENQLAKRENTTGWERDWLDFLSEWYDEREYIEVNTSGSTGEPKTISLKKDFVAASALRTIQFFNLKEGDRILHCLPARYIAGKLMVVRALIGQLDLHVVDPATDFRILQSDLHFKFAAMVINQVSKILEFGIWNLEFDRRNLDFLLLGGSGIPRPLEEKLQQINTACYSSYAMTETATHIALRQLNGSEKDAWYHCLDGISIKLNEMGCVRIEMDGLENGFLQTNDLGELRDEKTFRILGRVDNRIISGGLKFSPEELEQKLESAIDRPFYISSKPDERLGARLVLIVEGTESPELISQLLESCADRLTRYEQPREIIFTPTLPRTGNGKIKRLPPDQL
ncbi:AMP-binding protein [Mangrovibacterium diazotrophicum]|uniref:O-succinylbenzoic acid--CoA ligase n=1 Tax=Mangrovibacterium diazotrophicum TaxID=1261403 RepID=A0A419W8V5_9BACT|nr:AMP-binding protein [Mangrovibacterium diazotrophicum]RKD91907.1 O-succinylbenzoic acid--CoA ligase [Mangrovibacterium diazotrophicum]